MFPPGDGRFPDNQHADGAAQLLPGAAAVLLSERGSGGAAAGPPDPPEPHRPARQRRQVLQHKVSWETNYEYHNRSDFGAFTSLILSCLRAASSLTSPC